MAKTVYVQVGLDASGANALRFNPETVYGTPGDFVEFDFHGDIHSVAESTARLADPCNTEGGFDSGISKDGSQFTILITTHNSIYVHCKPHCTDGMVMIVNPGSGDSVETFRNAAIATGGGTVSSSSSSTGSTFSTLSSSSVSTLSTTTSAPINSTMSPFLMPMPSNLAISSSSTSTALAPSTTTSSASSLVLSTVSILVSMFIALLVL